MQYFIKDINGQEHGPVDAETLAKWVEEDRVTAETPVRSSLMSKWKIVEQLPFLEERLAEQAERKQRAATVIEKSGSVLKKAKSRLADKFIPKPTSRFEKKRPPQYAQMLPRAIAGLYDLVLALVILAIIYGCGIFYAYNYPAAQTDSSKEEIAEKDNMMLPIEKAERKRRVEIEKRFEAARKHLVGEELEKTQKAFEAEFKAEELKNKEIRAGLHENNMNADCPPYTLADKNAAYQLRSIWVDTVNNEKYICLDGTPKAARWLNTSKLTEIITVCLAIWVVIIFILNAFCLAYYSQTFGMWFWGIFITRQKIAEVYFFRALIFTLLYPVCFVFSPLFVYVFHRGLHEMLSGTRLIRVFSNRNA
jgi:hypothetical protein